LTDAYGQKLQESIFKLEELPPQIGSVLEANLISTVTTTASVLTVTFASYSFVQNTVLSASLNQLWSMINSQQVSLHTPVFENLKYPANAYMLNQALL